MAQPASDTRSAVVWVAGNCRWTGVLGWLVLAAALAVAAAGCENAEASRATGPRRAADFRSEPLQRALGQAVRALETRGFTIDGKPWRGFLVQQDSEIIDVSMRAGTCYVLVGTTSSALRELQLRVFDSDGGQVARDGASGGDGALQYCPAQSGTYYVAARAAQGDGLFAIRRLRGPQGLDVRLDDLFATGGARAEGRPSSKAP